MTTNQNLTIKEVEEFIKKPLSAPHQFQDYDEMIDNLANISYNSIYSNCECYSEDNDIDIQEALEGYTCYWDSCLDDAEYDLTDKNKYNIQDRYKIKTIMDKVKLKVELLLFDELYDKTTEEDNKKLKEICRGNTWVRPNNVYDKIDNPYIIIKDVKFINGYLSLKFKNRSSIRLTEAVNGTFYFKNTTNTKFTTTKYKARIF